MKDWKGNALNGGWSALLEGEVAFPTVMCELAACGYNGLLISEVPANDAHELKRLELDDDTLVIFTSDNGARGDRGGSNSPLRGRKGTTWEGGQRVPCIMRL